MRVATIDIGTNTVLLLIAERNASGALVSVREEATITRLGEGVDQSRTLKPEAVARTNACLERYADVIRENQVERVAVVGTSAMRDGGAEAIHSRVKTLLGVDARTISGDEEARLTFRGALSGLSISGPEIAVFDIGGGSTEIVIGKMGDDAPRYSHSFDVGSVRMTERHVRSDPPARAELAALRSAIRDALKSVPSPLPETPIVGIAGTMTTLVAIELAMSPYDGARVHGHELSLDTIDALEKKLAELPLLDRQQLPGLEPKRADVIVAGSIIASEVVRALGAKKLVVSDRGVRWGLAETLDNG